MVMLMDQGRCTALAYFWAEPKTLQVLLGLGHDFLLRYSCAVLYVRLIPFLVKKPYPDSNCTPLKTEGVMYGCV